MSTNRKKKRIRAWMAKSPGLSRRGAGAQMKARAARLPKPEPSDEREAPDLAVSTVATRPVAEKPVAREKTLREEIQSGPMYELKRQSEQLEELVNPKWKRE